MTTSRTGRIRATRPATDPEPGWLPVLLRPDLNRAKSSSCKTQKPAVTELNEGVFK